MLGPDNELRRTSRGSSSALEQQHAKYRSNSQGPGKASKRTVPNTASKERQKEVQAGVGEGKDDRVVDVDVGGASKGGRDES